MAYGVPECGVPIGEVEGTFPTDCMGGRFGISTGWNMGGLLDLICFNTLYFYCANYGAFIPSQISLTILKRKLAREGGCRTRDGTADILFD